MQYIRSALFNLIMLVSTLVYAIPSVLTFPFPYATRYRFITQWTRFNLWTLEHICGIRYSVRGLENIPSGPSIVVSKHQSTWETLALQKIFPPHVWVLKRELLFLPFFGWGLAMLEPIAINRSAKTKAMEQVLNQGADRLRNGRWVVVFPEGTRIPPGKKGRYKLGGAKLAEHTGVHLLPVAHNAGEFWAKRKFLKLPGTIQVVIGPPIDPKGKDAVTLNAMAEKWIEDEMLKITNRKFLDAEGNVQVHERR